MAIVKMNRFTLLTFQAYREQLLKALQKFGDVHLRNLEGQEAEELSFLRRDISQEQLVKYETSLEQVRFAAGKIAPYVEKPGGLSGLTARRAAMSFEEFDRYDKSYHWQDVCQKVREQDDQINALRSEIARRKAENENLKNWMGLDVAPQELDKLEQTGYLIGTVNRSLVDQLQEKLDQTVDAVYLEQLDVVKEDAALLLLFPVEQYEPVLSVMKELGFNRQSFQFQGVPAQMVRQNLDAIEDLEQEMLDAEEILRELAPEHEKLEIAMDYFDTVLARENARKNFLASDTVLVVEGWFPSDDSEALREILHEVCGQEFYLEETPVEKDSVDVPIKLKNNKFVSAFEDITTMYSLPRYNELDPTPTFAPFYWAFFGMMVGDMGYGLLVVIATLLALKFMDLKEGTRRFMRFFHYLGYAVIAAGVLYGSLFGVPVITPIAVVENGVTTYKAILDSQADIITMLVLSVALGVVHIFFGLMIKGYMCLRDGDIAGALFDSLLWIVCLSSGILWLLTAAGIGGETMSTVCKWVFFGSLFGLALTQGRASPTIGGKIGNGLYGVYGITSYVGDFVSYTRIVALALSGAYIAYSFNLMGGLFGNPVVKFICGGIIVLLGQALNIGLGLLGAYVHSCRLQYVEFFGKFYDGGGVPFKPLHIENNHVHLNEGGNGQ